MGASRIAAKNTLTPNDALAIEAAYRALLEAPGGDLQDQPKATGLLAERGLAENEDAPVNGRAVAEQQPSTTVMVSPIRQGSAAPEQGSSCFRRSPALSRLPTLALRCASPEICPTALRSDARSATNSPYHCAEITISTCIAMATRPRGGPISRLCQRKPQKISGKRRCLIRINRLCARLCCNRVTEAITGLIQGGEKARHRYRTVCDLLAAQPTNSPIKQTPASHRSP